MLTVEDIYSAAARIADGVVLTPCPESIPLSELCGARLFCKLDGLQRTGSFKERGARNALLLLDDEAKHRGVIAASAGNHASALAYHGKLLGIAVTVVMPVFAPLIKVTNCQRLGATVIQHGSTFDEARLRAQELSKDNQLTYVHGFDSPAIIAGQGTMGLEILQQVPDVDAIIVPVGGGGLLAGVAMAVKSVRPSVKIIAVESINTGCFQAALDAGAPAQTKAQPTLADGLAVGKLGALPFEIARSRIDHVVQVREEEIALAILRLVEREKIVVEGAAATALAACFGDRLREFDLFGKTIVLCLCGGNIDPNILSGVIEKGLVADGRLCRFTATISDRPGGLARLATLLASAGASVRQIEHDRAFAGADVSAVNVACTVETTDRAHIDRLHEMLANERITVRRNATL